MRFYSRELAREDALSREAKFIFFEPKLQDIMLGSDCLEFRVTILVALLVAAVDFSGRDDSIFVSAVVEDLV